MKKQRVNISRRDFLIGSATAGAGFSLGLYLPPDGGVAMAAEQAAETAADSILMPKLMPGSLSMTTIPSSSVSRVQRWDREPLPAWHNW